MSWFIDIAEGRAPLTVDPITIGPFTTSKVAAKVKTALSGVLPYVSDPYAREYESGGMVMDGFYKRAAETRPEPPECSKTTSSEKLSNTPK